MAALRRQKADRMEGMKRLKRHATISWNEESRQIRILKLLPGLFSEPIRCHLTVSSLDDRPQYETISYAWGNPTDTRTIEIENMPLEIPRNLESALRHLRRQSEPLALWADAICIDQAHREEKDHQVGMMGNIYKNCSSVNIWLGQPRENERDIDPFFIAHHFAQNNHIYELPGYSTSKETQELYFEDTLEFEAMWSAFSGTMTDPWWSRLWCVQESILPPAGTVLRGHWRVSWAIMKGAALNHRLQHATCCTVANRLLPKKYVFLPDRLLETRQTDGESDSSTTVSTLESMLRIFRYKRCQDPRDQIYGLLGLFNLGHRPLARLRPDYSLSTRSVFLEAMRQCALQSPEDLQFLTGSGFNSEQYNLPSWTRDFAAHPSQFACKKEEDRRSTYNLFNASSGRRAHFFFPEDDIMALTGRFVDEIEEVGAAIETDVWRNLTWIWKAIVNADQIARADSLTNISCEKPLHRAFWRTLIIDTMILKKNGEKRRTTKADYKMLPQWLSGVVDGIRQDVTAGVKFQPEMTYVLNAIQTAIYGRAFCRTKQGRFGLCFPTTRPGDQVWILVGGRVPFILQPSKAGEAGVPGQGNRLRLVGECYCHGLMDGEGLNDDEAELQEIFLV